MTLGPLSLNGSFSTRNATLLGKNSSTDDTGSLADTPLYKRLRNLQEGVQRLQTMASPASLRKQGAMSKIAFLKQRLDALKAMLLYATPAVAKALAQEVRSIAGELASIAKSLGGGSSGGSSAAVTPGPASPATASDASVASAAASDSSDSAAAESADTSAAATTTPAADSTAVTTAKQETTQETTSATAAAKDADTASKAGSETPATAKESQVHSDSRNTDDNDAALKAALQEARKRLKEVINLLKAKLNPADKKAKHDLQTIEKSLSELDSALQQSTASSANATTSEMSTYSVAGELSAAPVSSGAAVDTAA